MSTQIQQIKIQMQKELDKYLADKESSKLYFTSMKEISSWLKEK